MSTAGAVYLAGMAHLELVKTKCPILVQINALQDALANSEPGVAPWVER